MKKSDGWTYIVIGYQVFGRGSNESEAKKQAEIEFGLPLFKYLVYRCSDKNIMVDGMGDIRRKSGSILELVRKVVDGKDV